MSQPVDMSDNMIPEEPRVEIRRSLADAANYQSTEPVPSAANGTPGGIASSSSGHSINSVQTDGATSTVSSTDKAPLLRMQSSLLRSLAGVSNSTANLLDVGRRNGLSTFGGVLSPVALSMFSVLLFLRVGFMVGYSGIIVSVGQLCLAYSIIMLTVLSLCAISTNGAVEGGGVYYMISRALGPEFGGAIGVLFFLANVFSCGLYISGFREALVSNFGPGGISVPDSIPEGRWYNFSYDFMISLLILAICLVGAAMFAKTSVIVLAVVMLTYCTFVVSLMVKNYSMLIPVPESNPLSQPTRDENGTIISNGTQFENYTGIRPTTFTSNLFPAFGDVDYTTDKETSFALVFAVIFSGVTGIMAGANMSGELKRPDVSIPRGTVQAVSLTFSIYVLTTLLLGGSCSPALLRNNYSAMQYINVWPPFILIGVFSATFFAALSNLIGASRVLLRLAEDRLFGPLLYPATIMLCGTNPVVAVLFSWILVVFVLLIGTLNEIAKMTSVFFLLSYAAVNIACLALEVASAPNFRPTFRYFSWHTCLSGVIGCVTMMFVVNAVFTGIAVILFLLLVMILHYVAPMASWGSISQALIFHQVRKYLLLLDARKSHVKFWRPQILLLVANPKANCPLIDFVNDIKKSGLYVVGHVMQGTLHDFQTDPIIEELPYWLGLIDLLKVKSFVELTVSPTVRDGIQHLVRISGLGAMKANTVILGFWDGEAQVDTFERSGLVHSLKYAKLDRVDIEDKFSTLREPHEPKMVGLHEYVHIIHDILRMNRNICLARNFGALDKDDIIKSKITRYIDVWPVDMSRPSSRHWGFDNSCLFLLQLSCILNMVQKWRNTTLRVFLCVSSMQDIKYREGQLKALLEQLRITAKTVMVPWDHVICHLREKAPTVEDPLITRKIGMYEENPVDFAQVPTKYVQSMNETIRRHTDKGSSVLFINIPPPPPVESMFEKYMEHLDILSGGLPPSLMVHGISSVISTAL